MRIVHFSDWHGETKNLPPADLYVCTGDMLPNFRTHIIDVPGVGRVEWEHNIDLLGMPLSPCPEGKLVRKRLSFKREIKFQTRYLTMMGPGYLRGLMASPDSPVVCCRGNHDFVDLAPMFAGGPVFEISKDPTRFLLVPSAARTWKIGGVRGVRLHRGDWPDELMTEELLNRVMHLPLDLDILVTHAPPEGILDRIPCEGLNSPTIRAYIAKRGASSGPVLQAHLFGHIHEERGMAVLDKTAFSNASGAFHVIEL
ncbi:MAG: metallophosphoesterase [bacterium]